MTMLTADLAGGRFWSVPVVPVVPVMSVPVHDVDAPRRSAFAFRDCRDDYGNGLDATTAQPRACHQTAFQVVAHRIHGWMATCPVLAY